LKFYQYYAMFVFLMIGLCVYGHYNAEVQGAKKQHALEVQTALKNRGLPIKYSDLPTGHYRVLAVVDDNVVIQLIDPIIRDDNGEEIPERRLVDDMPTSMMSVGYTFVAS
jgi:hypothetical protein